PRPPDAPPRGHHRRRDGRDERAVPQSRAFHPAVPAAGRARRPGRPVTVHSDTAARQEPFLSLPDRAREPRRRGLTHVLDKGLSPAPIQARFGTAGSSIDYVKLGWGTGYISGGLAAKVTLCREAGVRLTAGGTLFEAAYRQGRVPAYARWLQGCGITDVEVS